MEKTVKVGFDAEADFLEVCFSDAPALTLETDDEAVMKRVDASGKLLGFSILGVSKRAGQKHPLEATDRNDYRQTKPNLRELLFSEQGRGPAGADRVQRYLQSRRCRARHDCAHHDKERPIRSFLR